MSGPAAPRAHFLLAGDDADLRALRQAIDRLPVDAYGQVFVEVASAVQIEQWCLPDRLSIAWLVRGAIGPADRSGRVDPIERGALLERALSSWVGEWMPAEGQRAREIPLVMWIGCASSERIDALCDRLAWRADHIHLHDPRNQG